MYPGRTPEQKQAIVRGITEVLVREINVPPQSVEVLLIEVARDHWAFGGAMQTQAPAPVAAAT
jgi:4-oxalocrotonate tautomerase